MFAAITQKLAKAGIVQWLQKHFTLLNALLAIGFLVGGGAATMLELLNSQEAVHRWHQSELAALAVIILGGTLMSLLWQPLRKPLLAQFFIVSIALAAIGVAPFQPQAAGMLALAGVFFIAYPDTRALLSFSREGALSKPLLGLSLISAVYLAPIAWRELHWQIVGMTSNDIHALDFHWIGSVLLLTLLMLGSFLAATRRPGWKELGFIVGGTFCYLGLIAMTMPSQTGSWGGAGGLFAISIGIWYILFTLLEANKTKIAAVAKAAPVVGQVLIDKVEPIHKTQPLAATLEQLPQRNTRELVHAH